MDFYEDIPRGYVKNLEWRLLIGRKAARDKGLQAAIKEVCREDVLAFFAGFSWVHEPRIRLDVDGRELPNQLPFIPWEHQVGAIKTIRDNLGHRDVGVEKSRDEGATWIALWMAVQDLLFAPPGRDVKIGIVSSTADMSDNPGSKDSLGAKIDWALSKLPRWMVGQQGVDYRRKIGLIENLKNGSEIRFWAAVPDLARGGRYRWFFLDELASDSWQRSGNDEAALEAASKATDSRLFVATPNGTTGAYYRMMHQPSNMVKVQLRWQDNPTKNRGLYKMVKDRIVPVDPDNNPLPVEYATMSQEVLDRYSRLRKKGFILDKGLRSPWYDNECDKADARPHSIAKELDLNYGGTMYRIFEGITPEVSKTVEPPKYKGYLTVSSGGKVFYEKLKDGPFLLWTELDANGEPPVGDYIIACDVSSGLGGTYTSNSVMTVFDANSRVQVAEFAINTMDPYEFCRTVLATCKWFHGAYLIWEHGGPGVGMTKQVLDANYSPIYMRKVQFKRRRKIGYEPGWVMTPSTKESLCNDFIAAVRLGNIIIRSSATKDELSQYVRVDGRITNALVRNSTDDAKGASHGDRVISVALAVQAMSERPMVKETKGPRERVWTKDNPPPYGTLSYRNWFHEQNSMEARSNDEWDTRSTNDLRKTATERLESHDY